MFLVMMSFFLAFLLIAKVYDAAIQNSTEVLRLAYVRALSLSQAFSECSFYALAVCVPQYWAPANGPWPNLRATRASVYPTVTFLTTGLPKLDFLISNAEQVNEEYAFGSANFMGFRELGGFRELAGFGGAADFR